MRWFSYKNREVHLGPYPCERLKRTYEPVALEAVPRARPTTFYNAETPEVLSNSMASFSAIMDAIRDGAHNSQRSEIPSDPQERANHLKAAAYFFDASIAGTCELVPDHFLDEPLRNPDLDKLAEDLQVFQPKTLAAGIDVTMADVRDSAAATPGPIHHHGSALVVLMEHPREPREEEPGGDWIAGTCEQRSAIRAAEVAVVLANYLRLLGVEARAHTASSADIDLNRLAVSAGLVEVLNGAGEVSVSNPYIGRNFTLAAITTTLELEPDQPLAPRNLMDIWSSHGPAWQLGVGTFKNAFNRKPYENRDFHMGAFPFEKIKRVEETTSFIDEPRVPRVPKRTDMFARALFGDMGRPMQEAAKNGGYLAKNPMGYCARRALAALILLQDGDAAAKVSSSTMDLDKNAANIKSALYFLGADAVGLSRCPDYAYYSHDARGEPIVPYHKNAISILVDQGHETMEGASGDDWISGAQSMRAYLRASILGGIVAEQIRRLGYPARCHSVVDGEVLQPPLLLLSGLGEVSRIGEVILNPYLGPRLKSGVITTDMPFTYDKPIDFGLQRFCESCNKCARECPSGAITAGPKRMFNGYEIWKSDSEKCARYRVSQPAGSLCGRCMKTCPWNLEGLFSEAPFRWTAMKVPASAKILAKLDDKLGNGSINPVKKWWWDLVASGNGNYVQAEQTNARELQLDLDLNYENQTLAVYPANLAPHPWPFPYMMDREAGIKAYQAMISAKDYKARLAAWSNDFAPRYEVNASSSPVLAVRLSKVKIEAEGVTRYEFVRDDGAPLPVFEAGAHIDVVIAPEFLRQYSLAGNPADDSKYVIGVLEETEGKGGSALMHRIFHEGRRVFISKPLNHFPLIEEAKKTLLFGGGIGVTPMLAMAHRLHALAKPFELHYCFRHRNKAGFIDEILGAPWAENAFIHCSSEGSRADLKSILMEYEVGCQVYTCGPDAFMDGVLAAATANGWVNESLHKEYFSIPDQGDYVNTSFFVKLASTGTCLEVPEDKSVVDVLSNNGIFVPTKCSDGICGVCTAKYQGAEVEHRDFVLSGVEKENTMVLCCSRAKEEGAKLLLEL
ncbi:3-chloro-4-hydroxyphenylacetate reductive dehalogenase precursor [Pseudovibrio axinellae]|uniref:3-chloro-4-hydroxyphenylacetate reductive dehalogenase n=1 Tax=Pseudovibrio axinellae TaxID=989403 RepID=A0A165SZI0_9HYPH|nr:2Fe-2S iron-sulfur cluster-binding protein [Pseudovibrio axinellae]KZL05087.1 3-chloro-4-hydroxyphenylacetate reductive dehalogenase precursor [Pseudovibrio axinellae]SER47877.1 reductive dehalogenase [Pseudovibrio axinellae]